MNAPNTNFPPGISLDGLIEVSESEFFSVLKNEKRNIHPFILNAPWSNDYGFVSEWREQSTRWLFGISYGASDLRCFLDPALVKMPDDPIAARRLQQEVLAL